MNFISSLYSFFFFGSWIEAFHLQHHGCVTHQFVPRAGFLTFSFGSGPLVHFENFRGRETNWSWDLWNINWPFPPPKLIHRFLSDLLLRFTQNLLLYVNRHATCHQEGKGVYFTLVKADQSVGFWLESYSYFRTWYPKQFKLVLWSTLWTT